MNSDFISKEFRMKFSSKQNWEASMSQAQKQSLLTHTQPKYIVSPSNSYNSRFTFPFSYDLSAIDKSYVFPTPKFQSSESRYDHQHSANSTDSISKKAMMKRVGVKSNIHVTNLEAESSPCTNTKKSYRGVRQRRWGKWVSEIRLPNKTGRLWLGTFASAEAAALEYDRHAFHLRGETTKLNFPHLFKKSPQHAQICNMSFQKDDNASQEGISIQEPSSLYGIEWEHHRRSNIACFDMLMINGFGPQSSVWDDIDMASTSNLELLPEIMNQMNSERQVEACSTVEAVLVLVPVNCRLMLVYDKR
ncbi:hypothetical protein V2J09_007691 [Rumex salicifolius]